MFTHPFSLWNCSSVCVYSRPAGRCLGTHIFPLDIWPYGTTHKTCPKYWVSLGILSPCSPSLSPTHPCWDRPRVPLSQIQCSWPSNPEPLAFRVKVGRGGPSRVHEWHPPAGLFPPCPCLRPPRPPEAFLVPQVLTKSLSPVTRLVGASIWISIHLRWGDSGESDRGV